MADYKKPTVDSNYIDFVDELHQAVNATATWNDGDNQNIPTGAKRWNDTSKIFEKFNGTQWVPLSSSYHLPVEWSSIINKPIFSWESIANKPSFNSSVTSDSERDFATPKAVKTAYDKAVESSNTANTAQTTANQAVSKATAAQTTADNAQATANNAIPNSKKSSNTNSDSEDTVATSNAIKKVFDKVVEMSKGTIQIDAMVGIPLPYPLAIVPDGFLAFNGQSFNTRLYPLLAKIYPSGILPDLRGEFIRGWDNGRGVDSGRNLLDNQQGTFMTFTSASEDRYRRISGIGLWNGGRTAKEGAEILNMDTFDASQLTSGFPGYWASINYIAQGGLNGSWISTTSQNNMGYQSIYLGQARPRNIAFQYICLAR
ncbi:tail fiber protein [Gallibacterium genomosp. 3]|uniref:tail fiber protein n=1 Tax=Gallibacterium genomosp. 3 TaxID=505345 RepID=UPI0008026701|nr:tail fiber protein [Gallibacterium genomosp. 3]